MYNAFHFQEGSQSQNCASPTKYPLNRRYLLSGSAVVRNCAYVGYLTVCEKVTGC